MSDQPSQESADLTSGLSGPVCASCGRQRSISGASECCDGIGPTPHVMPTSGKYMPLRKLTPEQVAESIRLYQEEGLSLGKIAQQMGVSRQSMHDLLKRRIKLRDRIEALPRVQDRSKLQEKRRASLKRYRSRAKRITAAQLREVWERDKVCVKCGQEGRDVDHIVPVMKGGQTELDNLQLLCKPCHINKSREDWKGVVRQEATQSQLTCSVEASRDCAKTSQLPASEPGLPASGQDCSLSSPGSQMSFDHVGSSLRTSLGSSPLPTDETWESFSQRWPKSGTASAGEWSTLDTSESPNDAVEFSLSDVLETTVSERFALSARAAKGILRRADARGRTLPTELEQALRELAA